MSRKLARFLQRFRAVRPAPAIRWTDVVRIEAMGTDAFSAFQIWLKITHADGSRAEVTVEMKGYWDIVESLPTRFPSISPSW